ncbi:hypothetical protein ACLOAV_003093 [Pseudogymnoascus australis]
MSRAAPAVKRRKLSPQPGDESRAERADSKKKSTKEFYDQASSWDLEQDYETRPRKGGKKDKENTRLPIKTADGMVQELEVEDDDESDLAWLSEGESEPEDKPEKEKKPEKPMRQQIMEAKEELAKIALLLNEDPEENAAAFKTLAAIGQSKTTTIKKLALATQLAIYKDIIPGYRIRPLNEDDMETKVSKEVRKLRAYEQALVGGYQAYIKELAKLAQSGKGGWSRDGGPSLGSVAIACACTLLASVPHFNFRGELLKILVGKLSTRKIDADFVKCRETIETLFREDEDGTPSLDATALLTKMMKARGYRVDESVLNTFLHLRLLTEFSWKASTNHIDRPSKAEGGFDASKQLKAKRVFRTKKQRKIVKEQKIIEKEMVQADATVSHEERDRMQAETLKLVFVTYFRILKIRSPQLMGAVLEGLASYAHLINQDFFGDLLEALKDLVGHAETGDDLDMAGEDDTPPDDDEETTRNLTREALLCIITAFALLEGQDAAKAKTSLSLDLSFFITHLYRTLHALALNPDIELSSKSLRLPDPNAPQQSTKDNKVNVHTTTVLLLKSLSSVLIPKQGARAVPPLRVAAYTKTLFTSTLHLPEKSAVAMMGLLEKVSKTHSTKVRSLWNTEERRGDGVFEALAGEVEGSNPFAATVWEGELLRKHFCPGVREGVKAVEKEVVGNVAKTRRRAKPGATSDATMSTNPRHTRTAATNGPDGDRTTRATSTEKSRAAKTFLDNWVEPSLPPPAPSFTDHPHLSIERYGVLENMAPLGTMPTAKAKKIGKDTPRRAVKADESEVEASTSRELVTPEPQINIIRKRSQSGKADDEEWNPRTPTAQARKSATKTKQSAEAGAMMSQSPHRNKEERDMFITDRAVQFAVEDAILDYRWPTAYALRTMYNDHRINPRIRRLFMLIFTDQATEEEKTEFQCLMTYKKKEGAKDNKAQRYFDEHDNLYSPVNLFQKSWSFSGASKRASTEVANRASASPHKDTSHVSKKAKVAHAHQTSSHTTPHIHLNVSGSSSASGKPAEMNGTSKGKPARQAQNGTTTVSVATRSRSVSSTSSLSSLDEAVLESEMADISGEAGQGEEISETIHSTKALRAREEPGRSAEKTARNQKAKQPITRHSTHAPRPNPHTFTAVNTKPPAASTPSSPPALFPNLSTNANNRNGNGDNVMRPYLDENYALPQSLSLPPQNLAPRSHKKGAAAALRRITTPRDEEIIRRKKEAKSRTDGAISTRQSFVRTPVQGPDLGSGSEAGDGGAAVVSQPTTRQVLRFRRRNRDDESDNHSSPTRLSFQPDLAPGSTRNSRANTPIAGARATRKAKSSGARMKTS